ncbi:hypothetical protein ACX0G7_09810 [Flavitalea antarctica]
MKNRWTKEDIRKLYEAKKVAVQDRPYVESVLGIRKKIQTENGKIVTQAHKKKSAAKEWIELNLVYWCNAKCLQLLQEHPFHPERKWRFDWCIPALKIAIEYEGGIFDRNGSHTSVEGMSRDIDKYNAAAALGWRLIRLSSINYKTLLTQLNS